MALVCPNDIHPHTPAIASHAHPPTMLYALSWFAVASLLALWSLATWVLHAVAVWTVSNVGALSGAASGAGKLMLPGWLAPWVPPELEQALSLAKHRKARAFFETLDAANRYAVCWRVQTAKKPETKKPAAIAAFSSFLGLFSLVSFCLGNRLQVWTNNQVTYYFVSNVEC